MGRRVLFIRLSALGDVIVTLPALRALVQHEPDVEIDWLVDDRFAPLLQHVDGIARVLTFPRKEFGRPLRALRILPRHLEALRKEHYDAVVDFQGNLKGALQLVFARSALKIGPDRGASREGAYRFAGTRVAVQPDAHRAIRALALLAPLGVDVGDIAAHRRIPAELRPRFNIDAALERTIDERIAAVGDSALPLVALHPGTSAFGAFKRWPAERFGELAARLRDRARVVVIHGPGEEALAQRVVAASDGAAHHVPTHEGIGAVIALARRLALFVGADSGPLQLSAAAGARTVALFGPKDPEIYAPLFSGTTVVRNFVPCAPCSLRHCGDPICMTQLAVDPVFEACAASLAEA